MNAFDTTSGTEEFYLKVHFDNFKLVDQAVSTEEGDHSTNLFKIYPNPIVNSQFFLIPQSELKGNSLSLKVCDVHGRVIATYNITKEDAENGITHHLQNGFYFIQWLSDQGESGVQKILVLRK